MAKLYATIESERTGKHQVGNKFLEIKIFYGSRDNSKLLTHILIKHHNPEPMFFQHNNIEPKPFVLK